MPILPVQPHFRSHVILCRWLLCLGAMLLSSRLVLAEKPSTVLRSARSGPWSAAATWEGGKVPAAGAPRPGPHGAPGRLRREVGPGDPLDPRRRHADLCPRPRHAARRRPHQDPARRRRQRGRLRLRRPRAGARSRASRGPALEVGTPERPIAAGAHGPHPPAPTSTGMDKESCPAIVCCGGRMDFHGAPMSRTWVKLGATAKKGDDAVTLAEAVTGWRVGDRVIVTATQRRRLSQEGDRYTEERTIKAIDGTKLTLDKPLEYEHLGDGRLPRRGRQPEPQRRRRVGRSQGRARPHDVPPRLGRLDQLRRVPPPRQGGRARPLQPALPPGRRHDARQLRHRRLDLGQRQSLAHHPRHQLPRRPRLRRLPERRPRLLPGRRHRGLQRPRPQPGRAGATAASRCPSRCCRSTHNDGAGFWWANSLNTFTRNVAAENDHYGFRFEATPTQPLQARRCPIQQPDGSRRSRSTSARCRSSASTTTRSTAATACTASTWARASTASARTRGIRSSSAT